VCFPLPLFGKKSGQPETLLGKGSPRRKHTRDKSCATCARQHSWLRAGGDGTRGTDTYHFCCSYDSYLRCHLLCAETTTYFEFFLETKGVKNSNKQKSPPCESRAIFVGSSCPKLQNLSQVSFVLKLTLIFGNLRAFVNTLKTASPVSEKAGGIN